MIKAASRMLRLEEELLHRVLPFALFMLFIALEEGLRLAAHHGLLVLPDGAIYYLYPLKALSVALLVVTLMGKYSELRLGDLLEVKTTLSAAAVGVVVFVMWISAHWTLSVAGSRSDFNPLLLPPGAVRIVMTAVRVGGAVIVVPVIEELFWRSFLLRYLVDPDFASVPLGRFTWGSFLATTVLFGLEHHMVIAGMLAGAAYSIVLYRTKSLAQCILAHAATNALLACYVLCTGKWYLW